MLRWFWTACSLTCYPMISRIWKGDARRVWNGSYLFCCSFRPKGWRGCIWKGTVDYDRRVASENKSRILVSLGVLMTKCHYFLLSIYPLRCTQRNSTERNALISVFRLDFSRDRSLCASYFPESNSGLWSSLFRFDWHLLGFQKKAEATPILVSVSGLIENFRRIS